jgi:hypothetical protein
MQFLLWGLIVHLHRSHIVGTCATPQWHWQCKDFQKMAAILNSPPREVINSDCNVCGIWAQHQIEVHLHTMHIHLFMCIQFHIIKVVTGLLASGKHFGCGSWTFYVDIYGWFVVCSLACFLGRRQESLVSPPFGSIVCNTSFFIGPFSQLLGFELNCTLQVELLQL